jgi:hypothetical protein
MDKKNKRLFVRKVIKDLNMGQNRRVFHPLSNMKISFSVQSRNTTLKKPKELINFLGNMRNAKMALQGLKTSNAKT